VDFIVGLIAVALVVGFGVSLVRRLFDRVTVFEFQRGLRYDRGRFQGVVPPGQYRLLKHRSSITRIDVRPRVVTVPGQEVITSDGVSVRLSLLAEYEISDPAVAINEHADFSDTFYSSLQLALRDVVAKKEIDDVLAERGSIGATLTEMTRDDAARLGLELARVELKDLMFPGELKRTFAQVVTARKEGLASLERARGETAALRSLANAARVMEGNPSLMHVRLLQELGNSSGNTIVVGFPTAATPLPLRPGGVTVDELEQAEDE
jgi:regulator of protease activity HflC (stomatin/prohibitin superfamily)